MRLQISDLQMRIWNVLTDEPKTAAEIAEEIEVSPRTASNALVWMRSNWLALDGSGFRAIQDGRVIYEQPTASWYRRSKPQWVKSVSCPIIPRFASASSD